MNDIFISYDDEDRPRIQRLVSALEARGWAVWWDHEISTGEPFAAVIERELNAACCVVVAWSKTSVQSDWVRAEADEARKRRKLVPVLLDDVEPPMPFGQVQAADLVGWNDEGHPGFAKLVEDLQQRIRKGPVHLDTSAPPREVARRWQVAVLLAVLALAAIGWYSLRPSRAPGAADAPVEIDAPGAAPTAVGHWQGRVTYPDGAVFDERYHFQVTGGELSGTASLRGYGNKRGILDGTVDGDRLSFRTKGRIQTDLFTARDVTYRYRGTVEPGDTIRFTVEEEGTGNPTFGFAATRISAEQAYRIATGGTRPRVTSMDTGGLYSTTHVRDVLALHQEAMDTCYKTAEYDAVNHEFVDFTLAVSGSGAVGELEMRPGVPSLEPCMRGVLAGAKWGTTTTGQGGTMRLGISARLPWNP